jgi:hypothetical protein
VGLADALGLHPGSVLAAQLPDGREVRFRVAGIVQALEDQGQIAYVQSPHLLGIGRRGPTRPTGPRGSTGSNGPTGPQGPTSGTGPTSPTGPRILVGGFGGFGGFGYGGQIAVKLNPGASSAAVTDVLAHHGHASTSSGGIAGQSVQGWASRSSGFIDILVALLRTVAVLDICVCLYAVGQALAAVLERWAVAPGVAHLAASYVVLALGAGSQLLGLTLAGLLLGAAVVSALLVRAIVRQPVVAGLRSD